MSTDAITFGALPPLKELRDYINSHIADGRGEHVLALDPRGLSYLTATKDVRLALPIEGEGSHADGRVFLRAVF